jgi:Poxvirus D5 protein-like
MSNGKKLVVRHEGKTETWRDVVSTPPELPEFREVGSEVADDDPEDEHAEFAAEVAAEAAAIEKLRDGFVVGEAAIRQREIAPDTNLSVRHVADTVGTACTLPPVLTDEKTREFVRKFIETDECRERREANARENLLRKALEEKERMIATLTRYQGVSAHLIAKRISDTTRIAPSVVYTATRRTMRAFLKNRGDEPAQPVFFRADFSGMARYVHDRGLQDVTAAGPTDFRRGEYRIPLHIIDAVIHSVLIRCEIWNKGRNDLVFLDSRIVAEVRRTLARMYPRLPTVAGGPSAPVIDLVATRVVEALAAPGAPTVAQFAEEMLIRAPGERVASEVVYAAYVAWAERLESAPLMKEIFGKQLLVWAGDS